MNDVEQAEAHEEQEAKKAPAHPRPGDEHAYEDSWYQVLRRRADGEPDAAE